MSQKNLFLKNNPEVLHQLLDGMPDCCIVYKRSESSVEAVYANRSYCLVTGLSQDEIGSQNPVLQSLLRKSEQLYDEAFQKLDGNNVFDHQLICKRKDGTPFWALVRFIPLSTDKNSDNYFAICLKDISSLKKSENDLQKALTDVQASKKLKDRFLANMSHEMRTPMNGILGMTQLLYKSSLTDEQLDYVQSIESSAENLLAIINDILEFNLVQSGALNIEQKPFKLHQHLKELFNTLKEKANEKDLSLELVFTKQVPDNVVGDPVRTIQIIHNLVNNAIKFTRHGRVVVIVSLIEEKEKEVKVEFIVRDTGIGIPEKLLNSIFYSFSQASKVTTFKYGGTGLGLSIVYQLVNRLDGRITVESKEGEGTEFKVLIPFQKSEINEKMKKIEKDTMPDQKEVLANHTVLVVDDHPINRKVVKGMLKKVGCSVKEAESGEDAIELLKTNEYSAVLMDIHMPGQGGLAVTEKIREMDRPGLNSIPIIAITASVLDRDIEDCKAAGMNDFIAKPFTFDELTKILKAHIFKEETHSSTFKNIEDTAVQSTINIDVLYDLGGGDPKIINELMDLYLEQTPEFLKNLLKEHEDGNYYEMSQIAHKIKPTYSYVGVDHATELAETLEEAGINEPINKEKIDDLVTRLKKITEQTIEELKSVRSSD
ncbi:MAG: response regulator [Balneolaceae bacterium]